MNYSIQRSKKADVKSAVSLLLMTMSDFGISLFGFGDKDKTKNIVENFFIHNRNRFSYKLTDLILIDDNIAGLLLSFPGNQMINLEMHTFFRLWRVYKKMDVLKFIWRILPLVNHKEAEKDEYYIAHLAVKSSSRRRGIGKRLLEYAEAKAEEYNLQKCSLTVDVDNQGAIKLYRKCGYEIVAEYIQMNLLERFHTRGNYRMVKSLRN